MCGLKK